MRNIYQLHVHHIHKCNTKINGEQVQILYKLTKQYNVCLKEKVRCHQNILYQLSINNTTDRYCIYCPTAFSKENF